MQNEILGAISKGIRNGDLVSTVTKGNKDKQLIIKVLKTIYEMKQFGMITEVNLDGVIWIFNKG